MEELSEKSQVKLDIKTLIGIIIGIISIAGIWFDLTAKIGAIDSTLVRLEYNQTLNDEFRIKWPRGELGSLPADAEQNMRLTQIEKLIDELQDEELRQLKEAVKEYKNIPIE